jgi:hypothetical protein
MTQSDPDPLREPERWSELALPEHRRILAESLRAALADAPSIEEVSVEVGPVDRPYDLTAAVRTDVGTLRTPLWSHARAEIFRDPSIHPANRRQLAPFHAVEEAADRLRRRLAVTFSLESRGLTVTLSPEDGVERTWSAERSMFRGRTAVTREDHIARAGEVDLRDLLAHFYTGPSLRLVAEDGSAFLLPGARDDDDARMVALCASCGRWAEGASATCDECGAATEVVSAARPARR